ncbi:Serine/threonine-protein kinase AfsK [Streptomyces lavendulae subsp. lavendulae]|uniref:Serine/threonine-protein kinase AfsK n=2 Tax=Streptomyces lavendulae TaxID=1914 RepID=A0A2K8PSK8_STRLA|nr:serine/threonine-protein kinase [Streptomyces lavendulae]ATZ22123.1 Serine/threonine-protein kinase AfsK [Streptomyces lavendulae subsp. lavendulae]ATZ29448.1 Serine/threonine-protein kinase AfsK [Streptomyces lavendulae subsp. lavendulae]
MTPVIASLPSGVPAELGGYRILGILGAGGMGTVYLAKGHGRRAALKTIRPELLNDQALRDRFAREVAAAASVRGRYVAAVLRSAPLAAVPWLASEFVAASTLEQAVRRHGPLSVPAVCALAGALGRALTALESAGVVHRDLKPSNVLMALNRPRVVDFGIARMAGDHTLTSAGQRPGTAGYMSPEQVMQEQLGPASDVFCAGALLVFAATGRHAFYNGDQAGADFRIVHEEPDLKDVPGTLARVVRGCMEKRPADRPTASEIAAELDPRGVGAGAAKRWLPPSVVADAAEIERAATALAGRAGLITRRNVLSAGAATVVLGGASVGALVWGRSSSESPSGHDPAPRWSGEPGEVPPVLWSLEGAAVTPRYPPGDIGGAAYFEERGGGLAAYDIVSGRRRWRGPAVREVLGGSRPVALDTDGAVLFLAAASGAVLKRIKADADRLLAVDRETVYVLDHSGEIRALRSADGTQRWHGKLPVPGPVAAAGGHGLVTVVSATGAVVALSAADGARMWRYDISGADRPAPDTEACRPAMSSEAVVLGGGAALTALAPRGGGRLWQLAADERAGFGEPTATGDKLYVRDGAQLRAVDAVTGKAAWTVAAGAELAPRPGPLVAGASVHAALANPELGVLAVHTGRAAAQYVFAPAIASAAPWQGAAVAGRVVWQRGSSVSAIPAM